MAKYGDNHAGELSRGRPKNTRGQSGRLAKDLGEMALARVPDLRADLESPDVPFVLGQLGPFREAKVPGNNEMNAIFMEFPKSHPNTACTTADGLTDKGDLTHFDAKSLREFGKRYAQAYLKLAASR